MRIRELSKLSPELPKVLWIQVIKNILNRCCALKPSFGQHAGIINV